MKKTVDIAFFQTATTIATYQNDHLRGSDPRLDVESRLS